MSFEDVTKIGKKTIEKAAESERVGAEDTQLAEPVETADTIFRKPEGTPERKGPGVVVHPKTEKEEFLERLSMYDEEETRDEQKKIRAEISNESGEKSPFLEKEVSDEQKQERFLEDLIIALKEKIGADIDRDETEEIVQGKKNIYDKIKTLLVISRAKNFENLQTRRDIFEQIHDFLDAKYKKDRRKILNELADANVSQEEKNRLAAQILNPIEQNYKIKLADFKNEYLELNLELSKEERKEYDALEAKNQEELTEKESKKFKKMKEKIRIIKELEEI